MKALLEFLVLLLCTAPLLGADFFPQVALGGGYDVIIFVTNRTDTEWEGWGRLRTGNNSPWPGSWNVNGVPASGDTFNFPLGPRATRKFVLTGDEQLRAGYIQFHGASGHSASSISPVMFYNFIDSNQLRDSTGIPPSTEFNRFMFPVEKTPAVDTGFAWALRNSSGSFPVTLTLFDQDGIQLDQLERTFSGHDAKFFTEVFAGIPEGFVGMIKVESQNAICLIVVRLEYVPGGFQLTTVLPETNVP